MISGRRNFLVGALAGVTVVGGCKPSPEPQTPEQLYGRPSFAQQGEDLVLEGVLKYLKITKPTYIDIGAGHPIKGNNTYKFFRQYGSGVLVEPNPAMCEALRAARPTDTVLEAGIGLGDVAEADYYAFKGEHWPLNTFSKEQADLVVARLGPDALEKVVKRQLLDVNKVMAEHFKAGAPNIFSIDIEGLDLAVLQTLNFDAHRPQIICVETMEPETGAVEEQILALLAAKNYQVRGGSFVNTVFVDRTLIKPSKRG